jgi:hypothetical protein
MIRRALLASAAALACAPALLPGTEIADTPDTRAIAAQVEAYRQALEKLDPQAVLALTAPDYFDNAGTPDPSDDVDRAGLEKRLQDLHQLEGARFQFTLRHIDIRGDVATAEVFFDSYYRVKTPGGTAVPRHDADVHLLTLKKYQGRWLFISGL